MKISMSYSHKQGEELLEREFPGLLAEVRSAVEAVNAEEARIRPDKHNPGNLLFDRRTLGKTFDREFYHRGWKSERCGYYVSLNARWIEQLQTMPPAEQKAFLIRKGEKEPVYRFGEIDYLKGKVTGEVQFGSHPQVVNDLFVKHSLFFTAGQSVAGVEILPVRKMQLLIGASTASFESEVYHLLRQKGECPAVPLLILGVEP